MRTLYVFAFFCAWTVFPCDAKRHLRSPRSLLSRRRMMDWGANLLGGPISSQPISLSGDLNSFTFSPTFNGGNLFGDMKGFNMDYGNLFKSSDFGKFGYNYDFGDLKFGKNFNFGKEYDFNFKPKPENPYYIPTKELNKLRPEFGLDFKGADIMKGIGAITVKGAKGTEYEGLGIRANPSYNGNLDFKMQLEGKNGNTYSFGHDTVKGSFAEFTKTIKWASDELESSSTLDDEDFDDSDYGDIVDNASMHRYWGTHAAAGFSSARVSVANVDDNTLAYVWNVPKQNIPTSVINDLNDCLNRFQITTPERIRHFLSQTAHESGGGRWTKELSDGYYLEGRHDIGNIYPGDGPRFKGAGYLQLTGRTNYEKLQQYTGDNRVMEGVDYVAAKYPFTSAGVWWQENNMNMLIDSGASVYTVTKRVNGGTNGLADREMYYRRALYVVF